MHLILCFFGEKMIDKKTVGRRIRLLRKISKVTQTELSLCLRMPRAWVSRLENGVDEISVQTINDVAKIFRCDIDWLILDRDVNA